MFKEAESRPDKIESTSNNVQVRKKQQHRRRACDLLASLKCFYWRHIPVVTVGLGRMERIGGWSTHRGSKCENHDCDHQQGAMSITSWVVLSLNNFPEQ